MTKRLNQLAQRQEALRQWDSLQPAGMSPNDGSHPGRPVSEELVSSRYALRIGEIDVLVISDGVLPLPTAMLAHNADQIGRAHV